MFNISNDYKLTSKQTPRMNIVEIGGVGGGEEVECNTFISREWLTLNGTTLVEMLKPHSPRSIHVFTL